MPELKNEGLSVTIMDYLREQSIQEECDDFARAFGQYHKDANLRRETGQPPAARRIEVESPSIRYQDISRVRTFFVDAMVLPSKNAKRINVPFVGFDAERKHLQICVATFEPGQVKSLPADIDEHFRVMLDAVHFLNGAAGHYELYAYVLELIKETVLFIKNEVGPKGTDKPEIHTDARKLPDILNHLHFEPSDSLLDYHYGHVYDNANAAHLLEKLGVDATIVTRDKFRGWVETFIPTDQPRTNFSMKIRARVEQKAREETTAFKQLFMEDLQQRAAEIPASNPETMPLSRVARAETAREIFSGAAEIRKVAVNIVAPALESAAADHERKAVLHDFTVYLERVQRNGYSFPLPHIQILLDCIFDGKTVWFREKPGEPDACNKIDWRALDTMGLRLGFEAGKKGDDKFADFMIQLYHWRRHLQKYGLLTGDMKEEFRKIFHYYLFTHE